MFENILATYTTPEEKTALQKVADMVTHRLGVRITRDVEHTILIPKKSVMQSHIYTPIVGEYMDGVTLRGERGGEMYTVGRIIGRRASFVGGSSRGNMLLSFRLSSVFWDDFSRFASDIVPDILAKMSLEKKVGGTENIKSKKYEDISVTYADTSESLSALEGVIERKLRESIFIRNISRAYVY